MTDSAAMVDDILVEIPDEHLLQLAKMYADQRELMPHAYTHILTGIEWKRKGRKNYMRFFSPNSSWKKDGTFVTINESSSYHIVVFSLDKCGKNVYDAIKSTNRIKYDTPIEVLYYALYPTFHEFVVKVLNERGLTILGDSPAYMMCMRKEDAEKLDVRIPSELYVKKLDTSFAPMVNNVWPQRYDGSEQYLEALIELNDGYGLFLESNDEMVAWCLLSILGQLGTLQTADKHRRKGYASLLTLFMAKEMAKKGFDTFGTITEKNMASKNMFHKLGFSFLGMCNYITVIS